MTDSARPRGRVIAPMKPQAQPLLHFLQTIAPPWDPAVVSLECYVFASGTHLDDETLEAWDHPAVHDPTWMRFDTGPLTVCWRVSAR